MVTILFTGIGYIPTNTQIRGVDVTINGDGHYAGVDVYGPPQRLATNKNPPKGGWHTTSHPALGGDARRAAGITSLGLMSTDLPSKSKKIHLSVVGIQQATPNWVVMPREQRELPRWG